MPHRDRARASPAPAAGANASIRRSPSSSWARAMRRAAAWAAPGPGSRSPQPAARSGSRGWQRQETRGVSGGAHNVQGRAMTDDPEQRLVHPRAEDDAAALRCLMRLRGEGSSLDEIAAGLREETGMDLAPNVID